MPSAQTASEALSGNQIMPKLNTVNRLARNGNVTCGAASTIPSCMAIPRITVGPIRLGSRSFRFRPLAVSA